MGIPNETSNRGYGDAKVDHEPAVWQGFRNFSNANIISHRDIAKVSSFRSSETINIYSLNSVIEDQNSMRSMNNVISVSLPDDHNYIVEKELNESISSYLSEDNDHIELLHKLSVCRKVFLV
jgi:hypothetical protein